MSNVYEFIGRDVLGSRPAASLLNKGMLYEATDDTPPTVYRSNGVTWDTFATYNTLVAGGVISPTIVDVKGDIIAATAADTVARLAVGSNGKVLTANSAQTTGLEWTTPTTGTVTSVAQTVPAEFAIGGSPVTTTGTLAITKATQTANTVWAGPTSGGVVAPAFRALVAADLPSTYHDFAESGLTGTPASGFTRLGADANGDLSYTNDAGVTVSMKAPMYAAEGAAKVYMAYGDGNAIPMLPNRFSTNNPTGISTATFNRARGVLFRLPRTLAVTDAYIPGTANASTGSMYKLCVYKASDNSQVWASSAFDTAADDWTHIGSLSFTLDADTDYYLFVLTTAASATNSASTFPNLVTLNTVNSNSPFYTSSSQGYIKHVEYTAGTPGTLDATMPALSAQSVTTGTCLACFFKGTAS